jgi:putative addiction module component (TIGR02574 family)
VVTDTLQRAIGELNPQELIGLRNAIDCALDTDQATVTLTDEQKAMILSRVADIDDPSVWLTREELADRIRQRWGV